MSYSSRCIPQVTGATKDATEYVAFRIAAEIYSVHGQPTIFPDEEADHLRGNFTATAFHLL